jgi:hypothetical protein
MSHFLQAKSKITDQEALVRALVEKGFKESQIKVSATPIPMVGYFGRTGDQKANIILPKSVTGHHSDIGFLKDTDGTFTAIVDEYGSGNRYGKTWRTDLYQEAKAQEAIMSLEQRKIPYTRTMTDGKLRIEAIIKDSSSSSLVKPLVRA